MHCLELKRNYFWDDNGTIFNEKLYEIDLHVV